MAVPDSELVRVLAQAQVMAPGSALGSGSGLVLAQARGPVLVPDWDRALELALGSESAPEWVQVSAQAAALAQEVDWALASAWVTASALGLVQGSVSALLAGLVRTPLRPPASP